MIFARDKALNKSETAKAEGVCGLASALLTMESNDPKCFLTLGTEETYQPKGESVLILSS